MTALEAPKALQASECSELLDPMRASCWISAQHSPGEFAIPGAATQLEVPRRIAVLVALCGFSTRATSSLHCLAPLLPGQCGAAALSPCVACPRRKCFLLAAARKLSAS